MNKKMALSLLLGVVISVLALYFSFKNVPLHELATYIVSVRYSWIIPSAAAVFLAFVLRAVRWQVILASSVSVDYLSAFHPLMIGFMINCILPGRIGEVARPVILRKEENVPFSTGLATVAVERVLDIGFVLLLFVLVMMIVDIDPSLDIAFGEYHLSRNTLMGVGINMVYLSLVLVSGILMVSMGRTRQWIKRWLMGIPSLFFFAGPSLKERLTRSLCIPLVRMIDNFAAGFSLIASPRHLVICLGLSLLIWGLSAYSYYLMAQGCPGIDLSYAEITAVMTIVCFFIALPSVPGFWGIWEAGGVFALSLFGVSAKDAAGYTLVNHAVQVFPVIITGMVSAVILGINILQVSQEKG